MVRTANDWLVDVQSKTLRGDLAAAQVGLAQALIEHPDSVELRRACAGIWQQVGRTNDAEALLRKLLAETPSDAASAFMLTRMLKDQGRTAAAASILRACFADTSNSRDTGLAIHAIELLDDGDRKADAAAIAIQAIENRPTDTRLHAYAGMLQIQLGDFVKARQHYQYALQHDERAWEWRVPIGLSSTQRYKDGTHPDFALFASGLEREGLSGKARAELHFALGKMHDDIGDYAQAAQHLHTGNALAHQSTRWSRKAWRRAVEARLRSSPIMQGLEPSIDFTPVFIVGMPRSGTTLLAELLSRRPGIFNRGELPWIAKLAERPALSGEPSADDVQRAAATYAMHARQDDAPETRWFIDKQPLNFRYVDLMLSMFPQARVIHCQRNARDNALSLWMQCFLEDVQGYAYDFGDIALVMRDCDRLMTLWRQRYPDSIRTVKYEDLVTSPQTTVVDLARWIGLQAINIDEPPPPRVESAISTASLWQARQPVNTGSIGRWRHYAPHIPALLRFHD